ncbi:MAG: DUF3822 family protein [Flavobacteriales bacterium]|nr:DUF3822 family protein [Flavobacteriales bacterium]MCB9362991.1 DUF3822 family protein [Flavobacteriales bacterium]
MSSIAPHISIFDKSFSVTNTAEYQLFLNIDFNAVTYTILNTQNNTFIGLEKYLLNDIFNDYSLVEPLIKIINQTVLLKQPFKSFNVAYVNHRATLIPNVLFKNDELKTYHQFNFSTQEEDVFYADKLINLPAHNVYAIPDFITNLFNPIEKVNFLHFSSSLIEASILHAKKTANDLVIDVHILPSSFQMMVVKNQSLELYNSFPYQTSEDFIYYVLFVLNQLDIKPKDINIRLLGEVDKNSAIYEILYKYSNSITFGKRPENLKFSYAFEEIPQHHYYSLFNQYLCE